jgi:hypothetical protein
VVELILGNIWVELGELIVHVGGIGVVLDVEVAMSKEGKGGSIARTELQLVREDTNDFGVLLISYQRVDGLRVLTVGNGSKLGVFHF